MICTLLPVATVHLCYWLAVNSEHVPACIPYWDSCTSISKVGRLPPEAILFKGLMIPALLLTGCYWVAMRGWLMDRDAQLRIRCSAMMWLGLAAACFLIVYTAALGYHSDLYRNLRRTGVMVGFAATLIAQTLETAMLIRLRASIQTASFHAALLCKILICSLMFCIGLAALFMDAIVENYRQTFEDAIEWNYTLLMYLFYLTSYSLWKNFAIELRFNGSSS